MRCSGSLRLIISSLLLLTSLQRVSCSITVAVECSNGVLIGTDSVSTFGAPGQTLIHNRFSTSLFPVDDEICLCYVAGGVEFLLLMEDILIASLEYKSLQRRTRPQTPLSRLSAKAVTDIARRLMHTRYRKIHLLVAGREDGDYHVYELLPGGTSVRQPIAASGPGAGQAHALASLLFEERCGVEEGVERLRTVLKRTIGEDIRSKGRLRVFRLTDEGLREVPAPQLGTE